jgi:PAS domain S-box-containing protein
MEDLKELVASVRDQAKLLNQMVDLLDQKLTTTNSPVKNRSGSRSMGEEERRQVSKRIKDYWAKKKQGYPNLELTHHGARSKVVIWMLCPKGSVIYLSHEWTDYTAHNPSDHYGARWTEVIHPDDLPGLRKMLHERVENRSLIGYVFRLCRYDGVYIWMSSHGEPRYEGDMFVGFVGSVYQIDAPDTHGDTEERIIAAATKPLPNTFVNKPT